MGDGRYRMLQRIGSGGMAEVLEAVAVGDHGFERRVAIKRLLPGSDAARERMFIDEARIASQLHHANIVAVVDYGVADGQPFQVLEHIDGIDAHALLVRAGGRLPVPIALHICAMVGHALEYAHTACDADGKPRGIVHRDVTPSNVLVAWTGDIKLTDFGIAFAHERVERTLDGRTKGTPLFMAPEQMLAGDIDARTDLFSLGCVLHALVTGKSPLSHEEQLLRLASGGELELDPALPDDVRVIVARATRYLRRDRHRDASELVAAITSALAARGASDPRTLLREWLRGHHAEAPARGRLDALLDVELVLASTVDATRAPAGSDVRRFTQVTEATRPDRPPAPESAIARASVPATAAPSPIASRPPRSRPRRWLLLVAAAAIAVAIAVVVIVAMSPSAPQVDAAAHPVGADAIDRWANRHRPAARELEEWIDRYPATASALFVWDDKRPAAAAELVTWATTDLSSPIEVFLATRPAWQMLAPMAAQYPQELAAFLAWMRKYPAAAINLMHHPRGLGWVGRQLAK